MRLHHEVVGVYAGLGELHRHQRRRIGRRRRRHTRPTLNPSRAAPIAVMAPDPPTTSDAESTSCSAWPNRGSMSGSDTMTSGLTSPTTRRSSSATVFFHATGPRFPSSMQDSPASTAAARRPSRRTSHESAAVRTPRPSVGRASARARQLHDPGSGSSVTAKSLNSWWRRTKDASWGGNEPNGWGGCRRSPLSRPPRRRCRGAGCRPNRRC